ncbi:acyl-CoA dehydrogenase family protein, partial [Pseudomonas aeruginosa]
VNGQKVWTSYADKADWIFCLVRMDTSAPKHSGISFLLFDMTTPGVSTRPILLISGKSPFCETFFDNVVVPAQNLVGEKNKGWEVAKYLLAH